LRRVLLLIFALALLGVMPIASANGVPAADEVWQIGDIDLNSGVATNPADEFNWGSPAGPQTMGPNLGEDSPAFTSPFIVGSTPVYEFPYNSNYNRGYATDFDVEWEGELVCGGELTVSWSPGKSATETKVLDVNGGELGSFTRTPTSPSPTFTWNGYNVYEDTVVVGALADGIHTFNFVHETGDGTFWDWVRLSAFREQTTSELVYGRNNVPVGLITVTHDQDYIYVEFDVDDPWVVYKTHVEVAAEPDDFPQNKGGLIPGQFTYGSGPYVPGSQHDTIMIPFDSDLGYVAFHAELLEVSDPGYYWAQTVVDNPDDAQGDRWDGSAVLANRSNPTDVLGEPDGLIAGGGSGFYSLGFGGSITVAFDGPVYNSYSPYQVAGVEITGGNRYPLESARVEFLYDGDWYPAATELTNQPVDGGDPKTFTYVKLPAEIPYAEQVRIIDTTDPADFTTKPTADGYDLDAVKARRVVTGDESGWGDTNGVTVGKNWSMYFPLNWTCVTPVSN